MAKTNKQSMPAEKPLTIIVTVLPPKRGGRTMIVSAARDGEMPIVLGGLFADRHHLLDQAYAAVLKREPQVVTIKEEKTSKANRAPKTAEQEADEAEEDGKEEKTVADVDTARDGDQLVAAGSVTEELPAIEGDDEAQLSVISSADEFPPEARGDDDGEDTDRFDEEPEMDEWGEKDGSEDGNGEQD